MKIILASNSPRRKELLKLIIPEFDIIPSNINETLEEGVTLEERIKNLAYQKAKSVFENTTGNRIIIGADTIVSKDDKIYGKPKDKANAKQMIKELIQGDRVHRVITGLAIIIEESGKIREYKTSETTKVYLKEMEDEEIEKWINTGKAIDKAGAYAIQGEFSVFIEKIEGNYTSVVGLPINKVYDIIKRDIFNFKSMI
ncbi:MAG: septum formation protein Maf [Clostridia bacterium]|nr:septum formation protein Maf [Clostridia bacterium]